MLCKCFYLPKPAGSVVSNVHMPKTYHWTDSTYSTFAGIVTWIRVLCTYTACTNISGITQNQLISRSVCLWMDAYVNGKWKCCSNIDWSNPTSHTFYAHLGSFNLSLKQTFWHQRQMFFLSVQRAGKLVRRSKEKHLTTSLNFNHALHLLRCLLALDFASKHKLYEPAKSLWSNRAQLHNSDLGFAHFNKQNVSHLDSPTEIVL